MKVEMKHRIIGIVVVIALVLIFVPLLVHKRMQQNSLSPNSMPASPPAPAVQPVADLAPSVSADKPAVTSGESATMSGQICQPGSDSCEIQFGQNSAMLASPIHSDSAVAPLVSGLEKPKRVPNMAPPPPPAHHTRSIMPSDHLTLPVHASTATLEADSHPMAKSPSQKMLVNHRSLTPEKSPLAPAAVEEAMPIQVGSAVTQRQNIQLEHNSAIEKIANVALEKPLIKRSAAHSATHAGLWVVQLGYFSKAANADLFIQKLNQKGYHAFGYPVSAATGSKSSATYVYVGPKQSRKEAEALKDKIKAELGVKGFISAFKPAS